MFLSSTWGYFLGRGEEAHGDGWLGVHMDTADALHFSLLTPTPQIPPQCGSSSKLT